MTKTFVPLTYYNNMSIVCGFGGECGELSGTKGPLCHVHVDNMTSAFRKLHDKMHRQQPFGVPLISHATLY